MSDIPKNPESSDMANAESNPFRAPNAYVSDLSHTDDNDSLIPGGQPVPAGSATQWLSEAWKLFMVNPLIWIVMAVVGFVLVIIVSVIPILGGIASAFATPYLMAGAVYGAKNVHDGGNVEVGHLFAGFSEKAGPLAMLGLLYLAGTILLTLIAAAFGFLGFGGLAMFGQLGQSAQGGASAAGVASILLLFTIILLGFIPLFMMILFAPQLIVLHNYDAIKAVKESFAACVKNILPLFIYFIAVLVLGFIAMLPIGLGMLVLGPVLYIALFTSYRDIFIKK